MESSAKSTTTNFLSPSCFSISFAELLQQSFSLILRATVNAIVSYISNTS